MDIIGLQAGGLHGCEKIMVHPVFEEVKIDCGTFLLPITDENHL